MEMKASSNENIFLNYLNSYSNVTQEQRILFISTVLVENIYIKFGIYTTKLDIFESYCLIETHVAGICLDVFGKFSKGFRECSRSPDTDLNPGTTEIFRNGYTYMAVFGITVIPISKAVHLHV
jgi:hypothetical protein